MLQVSIAGSGPRTRFPSSKSCLGHSCGEHRRLAWVPGLTHSLSEESIRLTLWLLLRVN